MQIAQTKRVHCILTDETCTLTDGGLYNSARTRITAGCGVVEGRGVRVTGATARICKYITGGAYLAGWKTWLCAHIQESMCFDDLSQLRAAGKHFSLNNRSKLHSYTHSHTHTCSLVNTHMHAYIHTYTRIHTR